MFIFVFYFQGVQGDDPITAGIKLAPMAGGMLMARRWRASGPTAMAPARWRRSGMLITAVGARRHDHARPAHALLGERGLARLVGIGSGMFNSPNTAAMMGTVPPHRRGIAAGVRMMLQNTGAVISIAFVMAVVTAAVPNEVLFKIFSGVTSGMSRRCSTPFVTNMHTALWVLAAISLVGAGVSLLRPSSITAPTRGRGRRRRGQRMSCGRPRRARSGSARWAELTGTTPRTIRYYEEIGLLAESADREERQVAASTPRQTWSACAS